MVMVFRVDARPVEPIAALPVALLCESSRNRRDQVGVEVLFGCSLTPLGGLR